MPSSRESIYNVNSDIRLEDYTEKVSNKNDKFHLLKIAGAVVFGSIILYLILSYMFSSSEIKYQLAIANDYIDDKNFTTLAENDDVSVFAKKPVYIRFQWLGSEDIATDYLRINIYKFTPKGKIEAASIGRTKPKTAKYVYFMGLLDAGEHLIEVSNRRGETFKSKRFDVR